MLQSNFVSPDTSSVLTIDWLPYILEIHSKVQREKHQNGVGKHDQWSTQCKSSKILCRGRKKDGETYGKKTLLGFHHGNERYLNQPKFSKNLKTSTDPVFNRWNQMLDAQLVQLKTLGKENSQHKPMLEDKDTEKLKSSDVLPLSNSLSLLRNVWFHIVLYFCRWGSEGQQELQKSTFKLEVDASRRSYVTKAHDKVSKNHPGGLKDISSTEKYTWMYGRDSPKGWLQSCELYFFQTQPQKSCIFTVF